MEFSEFEHTLKTAKTSEQINQILSRYLAKFGIRTFSFTYYSYYPNALNKLKYDYSTEDFKAWHQHYINESYEEIDSTLITTYQTNLPIFWDLKQQTKEAKNPREKQMRLDSITFGIEKGISIPIHGPQEDFALLLLVQMQGQKCLENWQSIQAELFSAAYFYYSHLQKILLLAQTPQEKFKLSKREIQCLTLLAKQYSTPKIAATLHITERTVNFHIQRLNKKFGTQNKHQTVAKAIQKGILS